MFSRLHQLHIHCWNVIPMGSTLTVRGMASKLDTRVFLAWRDVERALKKQAKRWQYTAYTQLDAIKFANVVLDNAPHENVKKSLEKDLDIILSIRENNYSYKKTKPDEEPVVIVDKVPYTVSDIDEIADRFITTLNNQLTPMGKPRADWIPIKERRGNRQARNVESKTPKSTR